MHPLTPWAARGADPAALVEAVAAALDGSGPALAPLAAAGPAPAPLAGSRPELPGEVPDGVAAVVATSGSTGRPRGVMLGAEALLASARATHGRLGGPGRWLLALPIDHVAGLQVLVRSVVAGEVPAAAEPGDIWAIGAAAAADARYAALVPAQLHRVVAAAQHGRLPQALAPLTSLEAILVGGAAASPGLLGAATDLGLTVVTTYGATETSGGCVYDGVPLDGTQVRLDDGVVLVAGTTLATGYLDDGPGFETVAGQRWFRSSDLGRWADGRLELLGRVDDVLVVGGLTVVPQAVEQVMSGLAWVGQVCVVGEPSERWGASPVAVVVPSGIGLPDLAEARVAVTAELGRAAAPRRLVLVDALPMRGPGKVDRAAALGQALAGTAD